MSLTPHWYSTIFGVYFFAGSFVGFIALLSVVVVAMRRAGLLDTVIGSWMTVSLLLMAGHFVAPFFYLMGRSVKRNGATLAVGGAWLLIMHFVDLYWQVMPTLHPEGFRPSVLDVAALVTVGGCFVGGGDLAHA